MSFALVIPSRTISNLLPCVSAVRRNEPELDPADIIVVDDGLGPLDEQTLEALEGVTLIPNERIDSRFCFSRAMNLGILRGACEQLSVRLHGGLNVSKAGRPQRSVILLNDDALLDTPGGFSLLVDAAEDSRAYGVIGAVTNVTGQPLQRPRGEGLRSVGYLAFIAVCIPLHSLLTVGLLDERFIVDYGVEDLAYCEACLRAGLKVGVHDGCYVDHGSLHSTFRGDPKTPKSFTENLKLLFDKYAGGPLMTQPALRRPA